MRIKCLKHTVRSASSADTFYWKIVSAETDMLGAVSLKKLMCLCAAQPFTVRY